MDFYGDKVHMIYIDTDGIIIQIKAKDLHKDMKIFYIFDDNNLGHLKSEDNYNMIEECVCLKDKIYCKKCLR